MQPHPVAKIFWAKLVRFGQIWLNWAKLKRNLGKSDWIWENLIRFEQNQNLASPNNFDLLWL